MADTATTLVAQLAEELRSRRRMLATAESCTGGLVAAACTSLAGSSEWFERGFVTYSNQAKTELLGVEESTLATHGAVSAAVARAMAEGALRRSRADVAVSTTGIAGPGGAVPGKPVGTVWFGAAVRNGDGTIEGRTEHRLFEGDREFVRRQSVAFALALAVDMAARGTSLA